MALASKIEAFYRPLREDIFKFSEAMGLDPTPQQASLLRAVKNGERRLAVKSGKGTGKTAVSNVVGLWRAFRHVGALTYVTAPTMRQCKDIWITEASRLIQSARVPILRRLFEVSKSQVSIAGHGAWGVRIVTAAKPDNIAGIHEKHLSIIVEEAAGIEGPIFDQIESTLTNEDFLLLAIGNPTVRECPFFTFFNAARDSWCCMTFNSEESPIVPPQNIAYIERTYGRDSDVYRTQVLGEFPNMDPNCIMSSEDLEACTRNNMFECMKIRRKKGGLLLPAKQFGVDFARFGGDENVIVQRSGEAVVSLKYYARAEPLHVVNQAIRMQTDSKWSNSEVVYCADANGIGDGLMVNFTNAHKTVHEFKAQASARKSQEFDNKITEAWFTLATKVKERRCYLPNDPVLLKQLAGRQYKMKPNGKIAVERKEDYVARGNESPDRADACVMAFYDDIETTMQMTQGAMPQRKDTLGLRR